MPSVSLTGDSANALSRTVASVKCVPAKPPFTAVSVSNLSGSVQQLNVRGKIYVSYTVRERSRPRAEGGGREVKAYDHQNRVGAHGLCGGQKHCNLVNNISYSALCLHWKEEALVTRVNNRSHVLVYRTAPPSFTVSTQLCQRAELHPS